MTSIKIILTGIVSVLIQFGLAIAGWGGWRPFWAHPAFWGLAAVTLVLMAVAVPSGGSMNAGEKEDRGNRWVLAVINNDRVS